MYICICSPPGFSEVCVICTFVFTFLFRVVVSVTIYM